MQHSIPVCFNRGSYSETPFCFTKAVKLDHAARILIVGQSMTKVNLIGVIAQVTPVYSLP